ncbi:MAG: potassium transporter TrkG [Candidatus Omnitrophica bacterium]|nr:potassium transporter TrkG [Candidatus Omnitrophota bacterium]MDD5488320.1 potassium transporter TrkG [Candidatus Omnitrophota bacterium]
MGRLTPPQLLILSFVCAILVGTAALSLPAATRGESGISLVDGLFTATSAVCVTGLVVKDTATNFSDFGRWVIFVLFQAGGLGIMTLSTLFAVMLGRKVGFKETDVIRSTLDRQNKILGLSKLIFYIISITFIAEMLGALALFLRWRAITDWSIGQLAEYSIFHSVSAFCNAGFSLFYGYSFTGFKADPFINTTMVLLIFFGGIGFIVIMDMLGLLFRKNRPRMISLHTKLVLTVSLILVVAGAVMLLFFEKDGVMKGLSWGDRVLTSLFQSVTARTAGFNTLDIGRLSVPSLLGLIFLMFVGASPGSTGGGIKTTTFALIVMTVLTGLKDKKKVMAFGRAVPGKIIRESMGIFFLALTWVFVFTVAMVYLGRNNPAGSGSLIRSLFETVSAFGTVGLSTGITGDLDTASKLCIIATMFAGRVGPLTLALAIAFREKKDNFSYPEENVMVG